MIRLSFLLFAIFSFLLLTEVLRADQLGCLLTPKDINSQATDTVKLHYAEKSPLDENMVLYTTIRADLDDNSQDTDIFHGNAEGMWRPLTSQSFTLFKPLALIAKLSRNHDVIYLCVHGDDDLMKVHVTLYFLSGYGLERGGINNSFGNTFNPIGLKISPIKISALGISKGFAVINSIFGHIPLLNILSALPLEILNGIKNDLLAAITEFGGLGVERVVLRMESIEIATGVDVNDPTKAKIIKTIPLPKDLMLKNAEKLNLN